MTILTITDAERLERLTRLRTGLAERGFAGLLLGSTESLRYFTGLVWGSSERFCGALVTPTELVYIAPGFEKTRVESLPHLPGEVRVWEEEESSAALVASLLPPTGRLALDDAMPLPSITPCAGYSTTPAWLMAARLSSTCAVASQPARSPSSSTPWRSPSRCRSAPTTTSRPA